LGAVSAASLCYLVLHPRQAALDFAQEGVRKGRRRGFAMRQKAGPGLNLPFSVFVNTLATKSA
jgi:hypothetical protein